MSYASGRAGAWLWITGNWNVLGTQKHQGPRPKRASPRPF